MPEGKIQIGIYKIEESDLDGITAVIESKGYSRQALQNDAIDDYQLHLFYQKKPTNPKWKEFFLSIANSGQDILKENAGTAEGFVLLLLNQNSMNLFALAGGSGYFTIQEYINTDFGIDILSRIINKEDKILKSTREKSVVGGILGTTRHFRSNFNIFETDNFGKIFQELKARLKKATLISKIGLDPDDIKKDSVCIAKSSFKINKAITFDQLIQIISGCESLLEGEQPFSINSVEKIVKKKNIDLIKNLEQVLLNQLWQRFSGEERSFLFDLCHKYFDEYLTASQYIIKKANSVKNFFGDYEFEELVDIDDLFTILKGHAKCPSNFEEFKKLITNLKIYSFDEEGNELTKDTLLAHILGDVTLDDNKYFFVDKSWYLIKNEFMVDLNAFCSSFISRNYSEELVETWDYPNESENDYNKKFINHDNIIVLDKITPENIEPCDILKWDEKSLYLYHVKAGFGNTMRDLCSQITISANRISQDINSTKEYIEKIYTSLQNKIGGDAYFDLAGKQTEKYSQEFFQSLFEKEIVFVLAVLDTATDRTRDIKEIEKFKSNIAKFSLQELVKEMRGIGINLKITQIAKS